MRKFLFTVLPICFLYPLIASAQISNLVNKEYTVPEINRIIEELREAKDVPAVSIAIINRGGIVYDTAFGFQDIRNNRPADTNSTFEAASLTKPVFTYAFVKLVANGKISLDTPLYKYFVYDDIAYDPRSRLITARMVLSHSSGLPNWRDRSKAGGKLYFKYDPGKRFSYSGEGYTYLGKVLEKVSGRDLGDYFRDSVFMPLHMIHSFFTWSTRADTVSSIGYNKRGKALPKVHPSVVRVAAGLETNATDYARFLCALMNQDGISRQMTDLLYTPQIKVKTRAIDAGYWGLSFGIKQYKDKRIINHFGVNEGFESYMEMFTNDKYGAVIFTNKTGGLRLVSKIQSKLLYAQ